MNRELGQMEEKFAELLWRHAPVASGALVELCHEAFGWKKSTMYTMLKRLCEQGLFRNEAGTVTALVSRADYLALRSEAVLDDGFQGSLPVFLAAFTRRRKLSESEVDQLQQLINQHREES